MIVYFQGKRRTPNPIPTVNNPTDLKEMASLINCRIPRLIEAGLLKDKTSAEALVAELLELYRDNKRTDIMWKYGIDEDVLNERVR